MNSQLLVDLEWIVSGWYEAGPLTDQDVKEMAVELHDYVLETYGPPF